MLWGVQVYIKLTASCCNLDTYLQEYYNVYTQCNSAPPLITYYIILAISISPDASHRMYYFLLTIIITSVIQRINGASLKETLGSTAK